MTRRWTTRLAGSAMLMLVAAAATVWAQVPDQPPLALTGKILFGVADLMQGKQNEGGPALTMESDLTGYWRDPRILQFDLRPEITVGTSVPGTEIGNALTGFAAMGGILQGSSLPLTLSYSRFTTSFDESRPDAANPGVLRGVQLGSHNTAFDVNWMLRFKHLPTVTLNYRDTDSTTDLFTLAGGQNSHNLRDFNGHLAYKIDGWQTGAWYQRADSTVTFPDILTGGLQSDFNKVTDFGFNASRLLPLHSNFGVTADQSDSKFSFDELSTTSQVRNANAILTSQPVERVSTSFQAQYTSNAQALVEQQVLAGAGFTGVGTNPAATNPLPLTFLAAPLDMLTLSAGTGIQVGHGFSLNGSVSESRSSNLGRATRWNAGPSYNRRWRSGSFTAGYSHSQTASRTLLAGQSTSTNSGSTTEPAVPSPFFYQAIDGDTGTVSLTQSLPDQLRITTSGHVTVGTLEENRVPFPYHDYGGLATLTRPFGEVTLTGSFTYEQNDANHQLIYNKNKATGISVGVAYRGLTVSGGRQYGSGLALQLGDNLVFVGTPGVVSPVLGIPILSNTTGTTVTGSYRPRRGRLELIGDYMHFDYRTDSLPLTNYTLYGFRASYKLRRLRLIAGYWNQSQDFGNGPLDNFRTRLVFFQIERIFRIF